MGEDFHDHVIPNARDRGTAIDGLPIAPERVLRALRAL
jgi:hypothetical protein